MSYVTGLFMFMPPARSRLERLAEQRGWNAKEVEAREQAQMSLTEKVSRADYVVDNSGPPAQTARQVEDLLQAWRLLIELNFDGAGKSADLTR